MAQLNGLSHEDFVSVCGPVFEKSPWIAAEVAGERPFAEREKLLAALCDRVRNAPACRQLALIRAHPDLVGRMAELTPESKREQSVAGLNQLTPNEVALFQSRNKEYWERFGFPFIICARLNKKEAILAGFQKRLDNSREQEIQTALEEIFKIADLRLRDIIECPCPEN